MKVRRILIIEDNVFYGNLLKAKIQKYTDAEIIILRNAEDAIQIAHIGPDIIFLDFKLGDLMNGLDILKEVKTMFPRIHIVMVSGQEKMRIAVESFKNGATAYIKKGVDDTNEKIRTILKRCEFTPVNSNPQIR